MEFKLLGPIEVVADGAPVKLGGRQRRTILAILLVHAGETVSTDRLIDELWEDSPPTAARKTVQAHVAHLRRSLNVEREVLTSADNGYLIQAEQEAIDVRRFESLVEDARSLLRSDPVAAARAFDAAFGLFRGAPLAGLADDTFSLRVEASRIEELRLSAVEDRLDALITAGESSRVAAETERLVAEHPLRERLWGLLMLSLYRTGRQSEALRAYSRARQTLAEELGIEPSAELRDLEQRILDQDATLTEAPQAPRRERAVAPPVVRNPYKGLRAFDEADASDFFGRDDLVRRLLERLESRTANHLTVLAGPSGAGKSSVVRAGLIPELREDEGQVGIMFPGDDPLTALAKAIAEARDESPDDVVHTLRAQRPALPEGPPLVLAVDQFEELFTTLADEAEIDRFLDIMAEGPSGIRWVVTVRADFLDRLLSHPRLGSLLDESLILVPPLQEHEVEAAVANPARRVGVEVETELIDAIVRDVQARPAALPLLQYALTDTFERRKGDVLGLAAYERAGGISGALARRADELYENLDTEQQEAVRQLFLQLVTVTEEGEVARRRVGQEMLLGLTADEAMSRIIERLGAQRLLTFDQDPETGRAIVEVAHEALISEWPHLAHWVEDAQEDLRMRRRLSVAAGEWAESGREPSFLLTGARLAEMEAWQQTSRIELPVFERAFLTDSKEAEELHRRRRTSRRRWIGAGIAAALIVVAGLGSLAITQQQAAEEQARIVRAGDLSAAANLNLDIDPELSLLLAMAAVETTRSVDGVVLNVAEEALHRAILNTRMIRRIPHTGEGIAHVSPDGRSFVTSSDDPTVAQIWSLDALGTGVALIGHSDLVIDAIYDAEGERVATTSFDGTVRVWDAKSGESLLVIEVPGAPPLIPAFSRDGSRVAASNVSGTTWIWDSATGAVIWELPPPPGTTETVNLEFSPDGSLLAVAPNTEQSAVDFGAQIWDMGTGELVTTLTGHQWDVKDVGFTPDGASLLTASWDTTVKMWDVATWENARTFFGHDASVWDFQISADGSKVASSGNTEILVWDLATLEVLDSLRGHVGIIDGIDLTPDGETLVTSSFTDGTTRVWDLTGASTHELIGLPGPTGAFGGLAFSPDGEILAASRDTGLATLWRFPEGEEIRTLEGPGEAVDSITFDPEGRFLVVAGTDGITLFDAAGTEVARLAEGVDSLDADFSSTGLLATSADTVRRWSLPPGPEGELISSLPGYGVAFDPQGEILIASLDDGEDGFVEVRDAESGDLIKTLDEHQAPVWRISFSADGRFFATASLDTTAIIWDAETFEPVHRLEAHVGQVFDVDFDPVRPQLATASDDGTIKIWDIETGAVRLTLGGAPFSGVEYSPDGGYLAAITPEGFVTVFILEVEELVAEAESRLTRWWTQAECLQYLQSEICPQPSEDFQGFLPEG